MTKNTYKTLAAFYHDLIKENPDRTNLIKGDIYKLCIILKQDNPRFNEKQFLTACDIED